MAPNPCPLRLQPFAIVASLLASVCAAQIAPFCTKVVRTLSSCPAPPTIDTVQIDKYTGQWFSIGTTAEFTFSTGQGSQCSTPNYTALGVVDGLNTIKVVNRGRFFTSQVRSAQSVVISTGASTSDAGVQLLCTLLVGTQSLTSLQPVLDQAAALLNATAPDLTDLPVVGNSPISVASLNAAIVALTAASPSLSAGDKAGIRAAAADISGAVEAASKSGEAVFSALESVQVSNNVLSGFTLPRPYSTPSVGGAIQAQGATVLTSKLALDANILTIQNSAAKIQGIAQGKDQQVAAAALAITRLSGSPGPLALTSTLVGAGAAVMSGAAGTVQPESPTARPSFIEGTAAQNASQLGALTVNFFGPPTGPNNYKIIELLGEAAKGYSLAVVYSCSTSPTSAFLPQISYFIISRTPSVPKSVVDATLAKAASQGIFLGGSNVFLVTNQDLTLCKDIFP